MISQNISTDDSGTPISIRGHQLRSRLFHAAIAEQRAPKGVAGPAYVDFYRAASRSPIQFGFFISGHWMIDSLSRAEKGCPIVQLSHQIIPQVVQAVYPALFIVQLNSGGPQTPWGGGQTVGPAPTPPLTPLLFPRPRPLTPTEFLAIPGRFACAAQQVVAAGAAGVEVQAAHGYLLHSIYAQDEDRGLELLGQVLGAVRGAIGGKAILMMKLGVRKGEAGAGQARRAVARLHDLVDVLELSSGTYTDPAFINAPHDLRQLQHSFLRDLPNLRPLVAVTGGVRCQNDVLDRLASGADLVGLARCSGGFDQAPAALHGGLARAIRWLRPGPLVVSGAELAAFHRGFRGELGFWVSVWCIVLTSWYTFFG